VFTSDHALKLEWLPNWVAIIGSGYIGLEFSDVYTALGCEVTFIEVRHTAVCWVLSVCDTAYCVSRSNSSSSRPLATCIALGGEVTFVKVHLLSRFSASAVV
jgi:hypothetical protein